MQARRISVTTSLFLVSIAALVGGCQILPNFFRETGPSTTMSWDSPTAADIKAHYQPAPTQPRDWPPSHTAPESGIVLHYPSYFEDPFVDKGDGRTNETNPHDVYRAGWEDYVAAPYSFARFTANWLLLPVSAVVTPPWTVMESDGYVSRQLLGPDHDATPARPTPASQPTAAAPESGPADDDGRAHH